MKITYHGHKALGDGCSIVWELFDARLPDRDCLIDSGMYGYQEGPGKQFANKPGLRRTKTRVLVYQRAGIDI